MRVFVVRQRHGEGYLRELWHGRPIVTGVLVEARQFGSLDEAMRVADWLNGVEGLVPVMAVEVELPGPQQPHYVP